MFSEVEKKQMNSFNTGEVKIPVEMISDLPESVEEKEDRVEKTAEEVLEERRGEFARLDLEAERWIKERENKNFWDQDQEHIPATKTSFGENENKEYFEKKREYIDALKSYRENRFQEIDSRSISDEEKQKRKNEVIKETVAMEAGRLYDAKMSLSLESKDDSIKEKVKEMGGKVVNWYRKLPLKHKLGVSAALLGTGLGAGVVGGATGAALATGVLVGVKTQRVLSGAAVAVGLEGWLHSRQEKRAENEVAEMFADKLKERINKMNAEMSEKLFELEGRKSGEWYKRYILSGTAGFFVGSGAAGKAIFSVAEMFGVSGDSLKESTTKGFNRLSGWFGPSELSAETISEGSLTEEVAEVDTIKPSSFEEGWPKVTFESGYNFVRDTDGNILDIDPGKVNIEMEYRRLVDRPFPVPKIDFFLGSEDGVGSSEYEEMGRKIRDMILYKNVIEDMRLNEDMVGGDEYEWLKSRLKENIHDLRSEYGQFLDMEKVEKAFDVKDASELKAVEVDVEKDPTEDLFKPEAVKEDVVDADVHEVAEMSEEAKDRRVDVISSDIEKDLSRIDKEFGGDVTEKVIVAEIEPEEPEEPVRSVFEGVYGKPDVAESAPDQGAVKPTEKSVEPESMEPEVIEPEPEPEPEPSEQEPEYVVGKFATEIEAGSSVWKATEGLLKDNFVDEFEGLNEAQRTHLINQIKNLVAEDPERFGLTGVENIDHVQPGQKLDLSPIMEGETMSRMFESARSSIEKIKEEVVPSEPPSPKPEPELEPESMEPEVIELEPEPEPEPSEQEPEYVVGKFATEIEAGSSVWKATEGLLKDNFVDEFEGLNEAQRTHLINQIKNLVAEDPERFGLTGVENIDHVQPGQKLDLSPIMEGETMSRMFESSDNLSQDDISRIINNNEKIEDWVRDNPDKRLTGERVKNIIEDVKEGPVGIDSQKQTISKIMDMYNITDNEVNVEAVKFRLDLIESMDLRVSSKVALADIYFENWNGENISNDRVQSALSELFGENYDEAKDHFDDGGSISKDKNGDVLINFEKVGSIDQKGEDILITISPQGTISLQGPLSHWEVSERVINDRSLEKIRERITDFVKV